MFRNIVLFIVVTLILSGCSGGLSGIMSSSGFGKWQIYKVSYQSMIENKFEQPVQNLLEDMFVNLGFERKYNWREPLFSYAQVTTFNQKYKGHYIVLDVEISRKNIIVMSTSYSNATKSVFNKIEKGLKEIFSEATVEKCFSTKDVDGHSCFQ